MRLLLINPRFPESFWSFRWAVDTLPDRGKAVNPPLGLATLAALCPDSWDVTIVDENIESLPLAPDADIVGVCGMGVQFPRQRELLGYYRSKGYYVVAGGSFASLVPERYASLADTIVAGEAEYIWPAFCRDMEAGRAEALYQETGTVELTDSPVPRFDLLQVDKYQAMSLQFSRGCPFRCEFCDIIVMFGRRPRTKSVEQVGRELDALRRLGARSVFFVDDNLIGDKPLAKDLLKYLADYQQRHGYRFRLGTEASINLAQDETLLRLFREANFGWVFIGIESPDEESLKETLKFQNTRQDLLTSVRTIYAHGLDIFAGFIIGFDHDTVDTFDLQYRFIMRSGIQAAMIGLLTATPKTPLYDRLHREGRVIPDANSADNVKLGTNVVPKGMTYDEMVAGYRALHERLFSDESIAARVRNKLRHLRHPLFRGWKSLWEPLAVLRSFIVHGLFPGGFSRVARFIGSVPWWRPHLFPRVVGEWIVGLSMQDYVDRHFREVEERARRAGHGYFGRLEHALRRYREAGAIELSFSEVRNASAMLSLRLRGWLDRKFFVRTTRSLTQFLRHTRSTVTLHIEHLHHDQARHLRLLLQRLAPYGDRIRITVHESLRHAVEVDSSVFDLSFGPREGEAGVGA
jgi:radical SAM superfamily enzyme YgiQ (UPF0313 family)